jgi:uncharacterized protein YacL
MFAFRIFAAPETDNDEEQFQDPGGLSLQREISQQLSSNGLMFGAVGQVVSLLIALLILFLLRSNMSLAVRLVLVSCGLWSLIFCYFAFRRLKIRPGKPLPPGED